MYTIPRGEIPEGAPPGNRSAYIGYPLEGLSTPEANNCGSLVNDYYS